MIFMGANFIQKMKTDPDKKQYIENVKKVINR